MHASHTRLIAASALALALTLGASGSSLAQRTKDDGTGGAAGYSPPMENPGSGAADAPAAPSATAPAQSDSPIEPTPEPDATPPPDQGTPTPDDGAKDGTKKDDGMPTDAPVAPDPD